MYITGPAERFKRRRGFTSDDEKGGCVTKYIKVQKVPEIHPRWFRRACIIYVMLKILLLCISKYATINLEQERYLFIALDEGKKKTKTCIAIAC